MKKVRKSVALFIAIITVLSLVPQAVLGAQADDAYLYAWTRYESAANISADQSSAVTTDKAYSGINSIQIRNEQSASWKFIGISQGVTVTAGSYEISFWYSGSGEPFIQVDGAGIWKEYRLNTTDTSIKFINSGTSGDFTHYTQTVTFTGSGTAQIRVGGVGWGANFYADEISLTKSGTTQNLVKNGGFELTAQSAVGTTPTYTDAYKDYFTGWSDWSGAKADNNLKFMCVTNEIAHTGDHSILIRHIGAQGNNQNICLAQSELGLEAGTYTISFWAVGTKTDSDIQGVTLADPWRKYSMKNRQPVKTDGIWSKYEVEVTVSGTETAMTFVTDGNTQGWYIDDISLVKKDTTDNRIKNGGFEFDNSAAYTNKYEDYLAGWTRWDAFTPDQSKAFSCVTDVMAHMGNNSVVIKHTDSGNAWKAIVIAQEKLSLIGTYTLSFWAAGDYDVNTNCITVNGEAWEDYYLNDFTVSQTDGQWKKYTKDITIPDGKTNNAITFASNGNTKSWYIDDVSLVKEGTSQSILKNGGFELTEQTAVELTPTYTDAYADYFTGWSDWSGAKADNNLKFMCVTDEIAHTGDHSILIRHIGEQGNNQNICLAQSELGLEAGTYTISFWAVGTKTDSEIQGVTLADPWKKYSMKNLKPKATDGIWSKYEIEVTISGTETAMTFVTDGDTDGWYIDDISLIKKNTTDNRIKNGSFEEKQEPAIEITPQYTSAYEEYFNGWTRWDALEPDGVLRFSCVTNDIAHMGSNSVLLRHADSANNYKAIAAAQEGLSLTGTYTLSFWAIGTVTSGDKQCFTLNGDEWVKYSMDNRVPVETDGVWSKYEIEVTVPDGAIDTAIAFAADGDTNGWYIDDVSLVKKNTAENVLKNGGFEEVDTNAPKGDVVKEVVLKKDGQRVQSLDGQGNYSVSLVLSNYAIDADFGVDQIVAIYDEDGVLYDTVKSTSQTIKKADCNGAFTTIDTSFALPEGKFTVEYFVFDGRDTLNIIGNPNPHRVFE